MWRSGAGLLALLSCPFLVISSAWAGATEITVGAYQNEPVVFRDEQGVTRGIYVDILEHIAEKEGWVLQYRHGSWSECLDRLARGQIDLLVGIGYSKERSSRYDFTGETVVTNWGQVYLQTASKIRSMIDLTGSRMAVVRDDIYYDTFKRIGKLLNIHPEYLELDSYREAFQRLNDGKADAALVPRIYGAYHEKDFHVERSSIMFSPTELRFAAPPEKNGELIAALNRHIAALKADKRSVYYKSLNMWIEGVHKLVFPKWLRPQWIIGSVAGLLILIVAMNLILRWRIGVKTEELKATLAAKEKIDSELRIAHEIQMDTIPKEYPKIPGYDMYGLLRPAREVGGDFYDFFLPDDDHLCFVLGDVSDKGVPAALFMAVTKTLIKIIAGSAASPDETLRAVNQKTFFENDACMFVTAFFGVLDVTTGAVRYTNAGHNPPLVVRAQGGAEFLETGQAPALGIDEDAEYDESVLTLHPGDTLFMYTDGVTEAFNQRQEMFSDERLQEELAVRNQCKPHDLVQTILRAVDDFAGAAPQADDIAMLAITRVS